MMASIATTTIARRSSSTGGVLLDVAGLLIAAGEAAQQ